MAIKTIVVFNAVFVLLSLAAILSAQEANSNETAITTTTTTTTAAPPTSDSGQPDQNGTMATSDSPSPSPVSSANGGDDGQNVAPSANAAGGEQQPKVFIIHHHYRDPSDFEFARRLQPVTNGGAGFGVPINFDGGNSGPDPVGSAGYEPRSGELNMAPEDDGAAQDDDSQRFDPLGQYSDTQKKRQFYQDLLMTHLSKFESEMEPMLEREDNVTQKNDMEEVLGAVQDLKRMLEHHQIFNISELMNDWKEGKIMQPPPASASQPPPAGQQQPATSGDEPQIRHHFHYRTSPSQPSLTIYRPPPVTRTFLLVPQHRMVQPEFAPHYNHHQNMFSVPNGVRSSASASFLNRQYQPAPPAFHQSGGFPSSSSSSSFSPFTNFNNFNNGGGFPQFGARFPAAGGFYSPSGITGRSAASDKASPKPEAPAPAAATAASSANSQNELAYQ